MESLDATRKELADVRAELQRTTDDRDHWEFVANSWKHFATHLAKSRAVAAERATDAEANAVKARDERDTLADHRDRAENDRDHWRAQAEGWEREYREEQDHADRAEECAGEAEAEVRSLSRNLDAATLTILNAEDRAGSWWEAAKHYCRSLHTWEENHQILAEHFNRYAEQAENAIDRLRERAHDAEDLAEQWRDRFELEKRGARQEAEPQLDGQVINVVIEVERETEHGVSYDRYPRTFGYGLLLGELVIYDHDGMNIANYPVGKYGCVSSWEQGADDA